MEKAMPSLIEEFKKEHLEIVTAFKEAKELGVLTKKGQAKLMSVKATLFEHLKKENEQLYPIFNKVAEQNKELKDVLDIYTKDLEKLSKDVLELFNSYNKIDVLDKKFVEGFERLFDAICKRIRYEEFLLFDEYEGFRQH